MSTPFQFLIESLNEFMFATFICFFLCEKIIENFSACFLIIIVSGAFSIVAKKRPVKMNGEELYLPDAKRMSQTHDIDSAYIPLTLHTSFETLF